MSIRPHNGDLPNNIQHQEPSPTYLQPNGHHDALTNEDGVTAETDDVTASDDVTGEVAPPDGGWGWMVVVGAGINSMLQGVMIHTFGLLLIQFRVRYQASAVEAIWACALNQLLQGFLGPLAAWLVQRYSSRWVTAVGAVLVVVGILSSAFAPSIYVLYLTYGVLPGVGFCLSHTASFLLVGKYFEKRKARALALTSVNHGLGAMIFGPVVVLLEKEYSFSGMFIILSAIFMHLLISAGLYRPLVATRRRSGDGQRKSRSIWRPKRAEACGMPCGQAEKSLEPLCAEDNSFVPERELSDTNFITKGTNSKDVEMYNHHISQGIQSNGSSENNHQMFNPPIYRPDKENGQSLGESVLYDERTNQPVDGVQEIGHVAANQEWEEVSQAEQKPKKGFLQMFSAILGVEYFILCLAVFSNFTATAAATSFAPTYALEVNLTMEQAASLVSVMGIFFTVGTLGLGSMLDIPALRPYRLLFYSIFFLTGGCSVMSFPLCNSLLSLALPTAITSASTAVIYSQLLTVLTDLLGRSHVAAGFGVIRIAGAIGALTGRMAGGLLVDRFSSTTLPFIVFGAMPTITSVILFVTLIRWHRKKNKTPIQQTQKCDQQV